jgi:hypothetical protein
MRKAGVPGCGTPCGVPATCFDWLIITQTKRKGRRVLPNEPMPHTVNAKTSNKVEQAYKHVCKPHMKLNVTITPPTHLNTVHISKRYVLACCCCCLLPAACCLLPAACCLLPAACCLLPAACCLLPACVNHKKKPQRQSEGRQTC